MAKQPKFKQLLKPVLGINKNKGQARLPDGQALIFALIITAVMLILTTALLSSASFGHLITKRAYQKNQALALAEGGLERAIGQLNINSGYSGESDLTLGEGMVDIQVTDGSTPLEKIIESQGYLPDKTSYKAKKELRLTVQGTPLGQEITFSYGLQIGDGGLILRNGDQVWGNVYSNGPIKGQNKDQIHIVGEAYSAGNDGLIEHVRVYESMASHLVHATIAASNGGSRTIRSYDLTDNDIYAQAYYEHYQKGNTLYTALQPIKETFTPPETKDFPLPAEQIEVLKNAASLGGTISGDYNLPSGTAQLGPKKITGNLIIGTNAILYLTGALYVQGYIEIGNNSQIWLDQSLNSSSYIIADGRVHVDNGAQFRDYYNSNYILLIGLASGSEAMDLHKDVWGLYTLFLYVPNGKVHFHSNVQAKQISAYQIELDNNVYINFQSAAQTIEFKAGPTGTSWEAIKGTWQEIQ